MTSCMIVKQKVCLCFYFVIIFINMCAIHDPWREREREREFYSTPAAPGHGHIHGAV